MKDIRRQFSYVSLGRILDVILQVLNFHYSPLGYLEERALRFVNVIDKKNLTIEKLEDNSRPIMDSKDKKAKIILEYAAKRKVRHNNLYASI